MNSDQLRQFKVIAECMNITKAAERLYITQPALSMALGKLEDEAGRPLFTRNGRSLQITKDGEKLLEYATAVTAIMDEVAEYFRTDECASCIKLYRIGGVGIPLLTEGCYSIPDFRLSCFLCRNEELPKVAASGEADIIIADDRYMKSSAHRFTERILLYRQKLLLCVDKGDPLAKRRDISVEELRNIQMMGRTNPIGFNDWLTELKKENGCEFTEEIGIDSMSYFSERKYLKLPYLMSSFGLGTEKGRDYFAGRKNLAVTGRYTERDVFLWYGHSSRSALRPLIERIAGNARQIDEQDSKYDYLK